MTEVMLYLGLGAIALPFVAYPALLWLRAVLTPAPVQGRDWTPTVDLIICAHNEAASIAAKIENALALDYDHQRLRIWVASDGSTDATAEIVGRYSARGVQLLDLPRGGKAAALNRAVAAGEAEILAFSDANSEWEAGALRALLRPLGDPGVGGVAGDQRYRDSSSETSGERGYWSFDRQLKRWQSRAGNAISATGAIYAIRRDLFEPAPADATDDFMISTGVIARGYRLVFEEAAVAWEPPATGGREFRRKVRIITRGLRAVVLRRALLSPFRFGVYAVQLTLHKLWRRLVWIPALALALASPWYLDAGTLPLLIGCALQALLFCGILALAAPSLQSIKPFAVSGYVVMVNAACAVATWNLLRGNRVATWSTARSDDQSDEGR